MDSIMSRLPQFGDNSKLKLTPANPAGFAHIGAEIKMKDGPHVSNVAGSLFSSDTIVRIQSAFTEEQIRAARNLVLDVPGEKEREAFEICAEKIPLIGRLIAHDTGIVFLIPKSECFQYCFFLIRSSKKLCHKCSSSVDSIQCSSRKFGCLIYCVHGAEVEFAQCIIVCYQNIEVWLILRSSLSR